MIAVGQLQMFCLTLRYTLSAPTMAAMSSVVFTGRAYPKCEDAKARPRLACCMLSRQFLPEPIGRLLSRDVADCVEQRRRRSDPVHHVPAQQFRHALGTDPRLEPVQQQWRL